MRRRGFSLIELLIAMVLLGLVGMGIARLLQSQMRFFSRTSGARDARAVTRNAINMAVAELRNIEPSGITAASTTSITVRIPYRMGIFCSASTVTFPPIDSLTLATAVQAGYASRHQTTGVWTYVATTTAPSAGSATDCTGTPGITPIPSGSLLVLSPALVSTAGTPVMLYQTVRYYLAASTLVSGRTALWRQATGGTAEEIAVPFDATSNFRFYVSGATTSTATVPGTLSTMTGLELVLIGESTRNSPGTNAPEEQTSRVSIFFRNAVQ